MNKRVFGLFVLGLFAVVLVSGFASAGVSYCGLGSSFSGDKPFCLVDGNYRYIDSCYKANCGDHLNAAKEACRAVLGSSYSGTPIYTEDNGGQTSSGSIKSGTVYVNTVTGTTVTEYRDCPGCTRRFTSLSCPGCVGKTNSKYCDSKGDLHVCSNGKDTTYVNGYCSKDSLTLVDCVSGRVVETNCTAGRNKGRCITEKNAPVWCGDCDSDGDGVLANFCKGNDCDDKDPCIMGLKNCDADSDGFIDISAFIKASDSWNDKCIVASAKQPDCNEKNKTIPSKCPGQKCADGMCAATCYKDPYTSDEYCCPLKVGKNVPFVCEDVAIDFVLQKSTCLVKGEGWACNIMDGMCLPEDLPEGRKCVENHNYEKIVRYTQTDNLQLSHDLMYTCSYCDLFTTCTPKTCSQLGKTCGTWYDGCSKTINCGTCSSGKVCENGQCVASSCTPSCTGKQCGSNGCGGSCGTCPSGQTCRGGTCCTPKTCQQLGKTCGTVPNGCGGTLNCGSCSSGRVCYSGSCCVPKTCTGIGKQCGSGWDNGCGGTLSCGTCPSGKTCQSGICR